MITPVLADMFVKSVTSTSQMSEAGKTSADSAFQKIFDSSLNNSSANSQQADLASSVSNPDNEPEVVTCKYECETGDTGSVKSESSNDTADNNSTENADASTQTQTEEPSAKVEKLKKEDPQSYDSVIANLDNMTVGELLSAFGIDTQSLKIDLNSAIPEDLKLALLSGDSTAINDAFAALGLGESAIASSLAGLEAYTQTGMATTSETMNGATSSDVTYDGTALTASTNSTASKISGAGDSSSASGQQSSMSGSDSGLMGGASNNTSNTSSTTAPATSPTQANNANTAPVVDPSAASTLAQAQTATAQQADAKPAVTVQNLTNETATNAINGQSAKTGEAQAQSNARPANTVKVASDRAILEQVVEKARVIVRPNGSSNMVIRLDPPSLGKIDMRIDVKDGYVRAAIVTESKDVKGAIESNIDSLKNSLSANGLKVDEISVSVGGDQGFKFKNDGMAQQTGDQSFGQRGRSAGQSANDSETAQEDNFTKRSAAYRHSGVLDVVA